MADTSPRMVWPYPAPDADPWLEDFRAFIAAADASGFAAREDRNLILMGGGSVSWNGTTGVLTWASAIEVLGPSTGFLLQVGAGNVTLADGQVLRGTLTRAPGANTPMPVTAAGFAANTDNSVILAIRRGTKLYWRNGLLMSNGDVVTDLGSTQGSGAVTLAGDVTGPSGSNTVVALRGDPIDPAISPALGDMLQWDGAKWVAVPAPTSGVAYVFVYDKGGPTTGNRYGTWAGLYAAANAVFGPKFIQVTDLSGAPDIPAGTYNIHDWTFVGDYDAATNLRPTLIVRTGVTLTGNFRLERIIFQLDAAATTPISYNGLSLVIEMKDADFDGGIATPGFVFGGSVGPAIRIVMRGQSRAFSTAFLLTGSTVEFDLYDRSHLDGDACAGSGGPITVRAIDNETVRVEAQSGYAGLLSIETPREVFNGPINESQLGTTELHIGSVYIESGHRILLSSAAMIGGSAPTETGNLRMRRFTGGAIIADWSHLGTLASELLSADVSIVASDWYDLYLFAGGAAETAVSKGLRLLVVRE